MNKEFAKLSKTEQEKAEARYHDKRPEEFDDLISRARTYSPDVIRLSPRLTATLKTIAKREGEPEYQTMITRWLKERLEKEARSAARLSKRPQRKKRAGLKRHAPK